MMYTWHLYNKTAPRPIARENANESGAYIGDMSNPDEIAEEMIKIFGKTWSDDATLIIARNDKFTPRNTYAYTVKFWKPVKLA